MTSTSPLSSLSSSSSSSESESSSSVPYSSAHLGFTGATVLIIAIVGTIGNLLAAVSLRMSKKLRQSPSTAFMVNLVACLLPVCGIGLPMYSVACFVLQYKGYIIYPEWIRVGGFAVGLVLSQVHMHTICALAFNRLLAVIRPADYKKVMQRRWVRLYLSILWLYSALLWLPLALGLVGHLEFDTHELMVTMKDESDNKLQKAAHLFFTFIFPIIFTGTCYGIMFWKVRFSQKSREVRRRRKSVTEEPALRQWDDQVTRTIFIIFAVLVSCSVPHMVIHLMHLNDQYPFTWLFLHVIFWLQFCLDPIVYLATSQQYRAAVNEFVGPYLSSYCALQETSTDVIRVPVQTPMPTPMSPRKGSKNTVQFAIDGDDDDDDDDTFKV